MRPAGTAAAGGADRAGNQRVPKVALSITIQGLHGTRHRTLRCEPDGGSYRDPAVACRALLALRHPFAPLPKRIMCPMILASGKTATITGTYFGHKVDATWPDGGCYLGRWDKLHAIFY